MNIGIVFLFLLAITRSLTFPSGCQVDEWQCLDSTCIARDLRCDSVPDCYDGSDEQNCGGSPICLEGLESCPQPDGSTICVEKAVGCGCGLVADIPHGIILNDNNTIGSSANVTCDAGYETSTPSIMCENSGIWQTAVCSPKDCGSPPTIAFGNITLDKDKNSTFGATALVTCAENYAANTHSIRCKASGLWGQASCISIDCGAVPKISHGTITTTGKTSIGSSAIVTCDLGYEANTSTVKCDSARKWEFVKCSAKDCGPVYMTPFGKISLTDINNTTYGATASITCDTGYEANMSSISCQSSGLWETTQCEPKDCGPVHATAFGKLTLDDVKKTTFGATASLTCDTGYEASVSTVSCQSLGLWETGLCKAKDCGPLPHIAFGKINLTDVKNTTYGASAFITCDTGYGTNVSTITCQHSGLWETAVCQATDCGVLPKISHGTITTAGKSSIGSSAVVTCDLGYKAYTSTVNCDSVGKWETAKCSAKDCGPIKMFAFGKISLTDINNTTYGATANITCDTGYEANTTSILCQSSGLWETTQCEPKDCGPVHANAFGKLTLDDVNNTTYGATASLTCDTGYESSVTTVSCQSSGVWETGLCKAKDCGPLPGIAFGKINLTDVNNTTYGASAFITCDTGYGTNMSKVTCQQSGLWETAICQATDCGPAPVISFGNIKLLDAYNTSYGASANVTCDTGFENNVPKVTCQRSGMWETAFCKRKDCGNVPVIAYGKVNLIDINNTTYGDSATVLCDAGFETSVSKITCQSSGLWETAFCTAKDCGPVPEIPFGKISLIDNKNTTTGASANVTCVTGFETTVPKITCQSLGVWQTTFCKPKDCGPVPLIAFGMVNLTDANNTTYGAFADVTCHTGFETNMAKITCQHSGSWQRALCTAKDCGSPPAISFGNISLSINKASTFGATAFVTCEEYYAANRTVITCQSSGVWENAACFLKGCRSIPKIPNGKIMVRGNSTVGSFANVVCNAGYVANVPSITCQVSGSWEKAECNLKACGPVPAIKHGKISLIDTFHKSFGDSAYVICDTGYETNTVKVMCQSSGKWETALCTAKDCGTPPLISNGNITLSNMTTYGAKALVNCRERYVASVPDIKCQSSGLWEAAECVSEKQVHMRAPGQGRCNSSLENPIRTHLASTLSVPSPLKSRTPLTPPPGQLNYDRCTEEHGVCTQHIYENIRVLALKSSKCRTFCHCAHAATLYDGSVTYKWVEHNCPLGTLFDDSLFSPVCNHQYMVWC